MAIVTYYRKALWGKVEARWVPSLLALPLNRPMRMLGITLEISAHDVRRKTSINISDFSVQGKTVFLPTYLYYEIIVYGNLSNGAKIKPGLSRAKQASQQVFSFREPDLGQSLLLSHQGSESSSYFPKQV